MSEWISVDVALPAAGTYQVKAIRDGKQIITTKKLFASDDGKTGAWLGGCRPFSDNDVVTHYQPHNP